MTITRLVCLASVLALTACDGMSNDDIIAEVKKCQTAGLEVQQLISLLTFRVTAVQCIVGAKK